MIYSHDVTTGAIWEHYISYYIPHFVIFCFWSIFHLIIIFLSRLKVSFEQNWFDQKFGNQKIITQI